MENFCNCNYYHLLNFDLYPVEVSFLPHGRSSNVYLNVQHLIIDNRAPTFFIYKTY